MSSKASRWFVCGGMSTGASARKISGPLFPSRLAKRKRVRHRSYPYLGNASFLCTTILDAFGRASYNTFRMLQNDIVDFHLFASMLAYWAHMLHARAAGLRVVRAPAVNA